jgi:hypothetical protein
MSALGDIEQHGWHASLSQNPQTLCNQFNPMNAPIITLIGGPTALIEIGGFRFLTDPTFDEPGEYKLANVTLTKTSGPALSLKQVGAVDAVLLSHDQHSDNLDTRPRFPQAVAARANDYNRRRASRWQRRRFAPLAISLTQQAGLVHYNHRNACASRASRNRAIGR